MFIGDTMFDKRFPGVKKYTIIDDEGNVWDVVKTKEFWDKCNSNEKIKQVLDDKVRPDIWSRKVIISTILKELHIK